MCGYIKLECSILWIHIYTQTVLQLVGMGFPIGQDHSLTSQKCAYGMYGSLLHGRICGYIKFSL